VELQETAASAGEIREAIIRESIIEEGALMIERELSERSIAFFCTSFMENASVRLAAHAHP
jgi:hypothetical protein